MKQIVIVVIPIYQETLDVVGLTSLRQCFKILNNRSISFTCPVGLDTSFYENEAKLGRVNVRFERFEEKYFHGIEGYNNLLLSTNFYLRFRDYKFLLIYQTDAFVFTDELDYWCSKKFDYIGAPWFKVENSEYTLKMSDVGNGGFSLRHVPHSLKMLKRIKQLKQLRSAYFLLRFDLVIKFGTLVNMLSRRFKIKDKKNFHYIWNYTDTNEDFFWTKIIGSIFSDFVVAPNEDAAKFSFEVNPTFLFSLNQQRLPFGCHAWEKYEPDFWNQFIKLEELDSSTT